MPGTQEERIPEGPTLISTAKLETESQTFCIFAEPLGIDHPSPKYPIGLVTLDKVKSRSTGAVSWHLGFVGIRHLIE